MNNKKCSAEYLWKRIEDHVSPRLRLSLSERVVYWHLLRHTLLEGKPRLRFAISWLARGTRLCNGAVRHSVRRLVAKGALRLVERSCSGHVIEAIHPDEIRGARPNPISARSRHARELETTDFLKTEVLREAIHARERGLCFYCLRQVSERLRCLDHVVPRVQAGPNSYRNLVSACPECNSTKGMTRAEDYLRKLYRQRRLTDDELNGRLRALDDLAAGRLRPAVAAP